MIRMQIISWSHSLRLHGKSGKLTIDDCVCNTLWRAPELGAVYTCLPWATTLTTRPSDHIMSSSKVLVDITCFSVFSAFRIHTGAGTGLGSLPGPRVPQINVTGPERSS